MLYKYYIIYTYNYYRIIIIFIISIIIISLVYNNWYIIIILQLNLHIIGSVNGMKYMSDFTFTGHGTRSIPVLKARLIGLSNLWVLLQLVITYWFCILWEEKKLIITNLDLVVFYVLNAGVAFGPRLPNVFLSDDCRSRLWSAAFPCLFRYCNWKFNR